MRSKNFPKEKNLLDKLKDENKKLKRELSKLKKQFDRVDPSRYEDVREALEHYIVDEEKKFEEKSLRDKWLCWDCGRGVLKIKKFPTPSGTRYLRKCDFCNKKTKMQSFHDGVDDAV